MGTTLLLGSAISLLIVGMGILFWVGAWWAWRRWSHEMHHLVLVEGTLLALECRDRTVRDNKRLTEYWARYSYAYEGQSYKGRQTISKKHYRTWKRGRRLTIRLSSNQPEDGNLVAQASLLGDTALIWGFGLAGLACFGGAYLCFWLVVLQPA